MSVNKKVVLQVYPKEHWPSWAMIANTDIRTRSNHTYRAQNTLTSSHIQCFPIVANNGKLAIVRVADLANCQPVFESFFEKHCISPLNYVNRNLYSANCFSWHWWTAGMVSRVSEEFICGQEFQYHCRCSVCVLWFRPRYQIFIVAQVYMISVDWCHDDQDPGSLSCFGATVRSS